MSTHLPGDVYELHIQWPHRHHFGGRSQNVPFWPGRLLSSVPSSMTPCLSLSVFLWREYSTNTLQSVSSLSNGTTVLFRELNSRHLCYQNSTSSTISSPMWQLHAATLSAFAVAVLLKPAEDCDKLTQRVCSCGSANLYSELFWDPEFCILIVYTWAVLLVSNFQRSTVGPCCREQMASVSAEYRFPDFPPDMT